MFPNTNADGKIRLNTIFNANFIYDNNRATLLSLANSRITFQQMNYINYSQ